MISISGLNKAEVLAALYNAARPQGMGFLMYKPEPMTVRQAQEILDSGQDYFDYLNGRVMKLSLKNDDEFEERLYDRDNGTGAAGQVISVLRTKPGLINAEEIRNIHAEGKLTAAAHVKTKLHEETKFDGGTVTLGFADVTEPLSEAVDKAIS